MGGREGSSSIARRRIPGIRGRSASRGRSATPSKDDDKVNGSGNGGGMTTPKTKFNKLKKLIPRSRSRSRVRVPSFGNGNHNGRNSNSDKDVNGHSTPNSKTNANSHSNNNTHTPGKTSSSTESTFSPDGTVERVVVTPKVTVTRDAQPMTSPRSAGTVSVSTDAERDAPPDDHIHHHHHPSTPTPHSPALNHTHTPKIIHHASERDGFCRRVDSYDGQVVVVDDLPTYEVGNYLGGGVAGVVYEGRRLRPIKEYPTRPAYMDRNMNMDGTGTGTGGDLKKCNSLLVDAAENEGQMPNSPQVNQGCSSMIFCGNPSSHATFNDSRIDDLKLKVDDDLNKSAGINHYHYKTKKKNNNNKNNDADANADDAAHDDLMSQETVAIKILNPVGFRLVSPSACGQAIVVKRGMDMDYETKKGLKPMREEHVWWLVNPTSKSSRRKMKDNNNNNNGSGNGGSSSNKNNKNNTHNPNKSLDVTDEDRYLAVEPAKEGLKLSLIAAYMEPKSNTLKELPLVRCIEIWGHAPFGSTEDEFENMMDAIERVNNGQSSMDVYAAGGDNDIPLMEGIKIEESGLFRAANAKKSVEFCPDLNAHVTVPACPPKFIRWLRQRRAVTKEIRNMMRIGRHKNVVHLFEVLELVQDSKSTMFLILELVRGGELFDLISSNTATSKMLDQSVEHLSEAEQNEYAMLRYFKELSSGIAYCHDNGIAHRDLKPENLLVHNGPRGDCTLKIADFGLSATFNLQHQQSNSQDDRYPSPGYCGGGMPSRASRPPSPAPVSGLSPLFKRNFVTALSFLTCGGVEQINECFQPYHKEPGTKAEALQRMTSIVGSPHYVAPEIISQSDEKKSISSASDIKGYDGTKADVWSAGVILYAMLFRSLPFGEDLLRCPRYQSFIKWYKEARRVGGRRSSAAAALTDISLDTESEDLGPSWFFPSKTSPESKDLIVAMLNPDPIERLNILQVLRHPWLSLTFGV